MVVHLIVIRGRCKFILLICTLKYLKWLSIPKLTNRNFFDSKWKSIRT